MRDAISSSAPVRIPRLLIAGTHSGVGKTTLTAGVIAALRSKGLEVQPFKVGPDYIDPTYHTLAANLGVNEGRERACRNLDSWMIPPERLLTIFVAAARAADVAVIEGVMGLYDGFGYEDDAGSSAHVAGLLQAPVVLVIDAGHMARSAGAVALGYQKFAPQLSLRGFIVNRVAGAGHGQGVAQAIRRATGLPVFGWVPRDALLSIPERHLGLIPTLERGRWQAFVQRAGEVVAQYLDVQALLELARSADPLPDGLPWFAAAPMHRARIAVARDEAFSFTYEDNLELLRAAGAEIALFSPLRDAALPEGAQGVILSGGFPELYAPQLAANEGMLVALRDAHARGLPIYAECGGLMYLTGSIEALDGQRYPMVGLLPGRAIMTKRLTMGYRLACAAGDSWLLRQGETVRAHEFHYSAWENRPRDLPPAYSLRASHADGQAWQEGACLGNLFASYVHIHLASMPELAIRFVEACERVRG